MHYRDDQTGLEARRDDLRQKLDEIRARTQELDEQLRSRKDVERELASVEARLAHASRRLPLLDRVYVASPCHASWEAMTGDERARFCKSCEKTVYNLSAMTRKDAETLLAEHGERACVRFYRREDGTVMTADCPVGARKKRVKRTIYTAAGAGAMAATALFALRRGVEPHEMGNMNVSPMMGGTGAAARFPEGPPLPTAQPAPEASAQPLPVRSVGPDYPSAPTAGIVAFHGPRMGKPASKPQNNKPARPQTKP
jgi:hypothetical protein